MTLTPQELKPCPAEHNSSRVIGGPGTAGGPKYWAGCDHCNWRAWGNTEAEAITAWNQRTTPPEPVDARELLPVSQAARELIERLRAQGARASEVSRQMAEAKSLRQEGNAERRTDLYMWPKPEDTLEYKAAAFIERSLGEREPAPSSERELRNALGSAYETLSRIWQTNECEQTKAAAVQECASIEAALASTTREPALDLHTLEEARQQGQREGKAAACQWLRDRSATKPPATYWSAAAALADQFEQSEQPGCAQ